MDRAFPKVLKCTKPRNLVYDLFCNIDYPITAKEIHRILNSNGKELWLSTIYRVLDDFTAHSIINKSGSMLSNVYVYTKGESHTHYAICSSCEKTIPISFCPSELFESELRKQGFIIKDHEFNALGICRNCETNK